MVEYKDFFYESDKKHGVGNSSNLTDTLRNVKEEIRIFKADNNKIMQAQEKQVKVNAILQSLS